MKKYVIEILMDYDEQNPQDINDFLVDFKTGFNTMAKPNAEIHRVKFKEVV